jgi:hypothetical protein
MELVQTNSAELPPVSWAGVSFFGRISYKSTFDALAWPAAMRLLLPASPPPITVTFSVISFNPSLKNSLLTILRVKSFSLPNRTL